MKKRTGGWVTLSDEVRYDNPWIRVHHQAVQRPNGSEGIYGVVHFKNQAVGVLPLDAEGNTWLVRQSRYTLDRYTWEIPEGGSPEGEDPLATAKRELAEEAGIQAATWQPLLTIHTSNSVTDEVGHVFLARDLSFCQQALEATEDIVVKKLPFEEALAMAMADEITDSLSQAALFKAALLIARGELRLR